MSPYDFASCVIKSLSSPPNSIYPSKSGNKNTMLIYINMGFPGGTSGQESAYQPRRPRDLS